MSENDVSRESTDVQNLLHGILADPCRRATLQYLAARTVPVTADRLAMEVAATGSGIPVEDVTSEEQHRTLLALVHVHLPKLHEAGLVRWDRDADQVSPGPLLERLSVTTPVAGSFLDVSISVRPKAK